MGWLYGEGRVGPSSVPHHISAINTTLHALRIITPADRYTSARERTLKARKEYHKRWIGTPAAPRVAMQFEAIFEIAWTGIRALDHGVSGVARDGVSILFQFINLVDQDCHPGFGEHESLIPPKKGRCMTYLPGNPAERPKTGLLFACFAAGRAVTMTARHRGIFFGAYSNMACRRETVDSYISFCCSEWKKCSSKAFSSGAFDTRSCNHRM